MGFSRRLRLSVSAARHWRRGLPQVKNVAARQRAATSRAPIRCIEGAEYRDVRARSDAGRRCAARRAGRAGLRPGRHPRPAGLRPRGEAAADGLDEAARKEAIVQALAARASRLAEAVDDALTLASDGAIRWLGDPIGKLIVGAGSLEPGAALLADEALPRKGASGRTPSVAVDRRSSA